MQETTHDKIKGEIERYTKLSILIHLLSIFMFRIDKNNKNGIDMAKFLLIEIVLKYLINILIAYK